MTPDSNTASTSDTPAATPPDETPQVTDQTPAAADGQPTGGAVTVDDATPHKAPDAAGLRDGMSIQQMVEQVLTAQAEPRVITSAKKLYLRQTNRADTLDVAQRRDRYYRQALAEGHDPSFAFQAVDILEPPPAHRYEVTTDPANADIVLAHPNEPFDARELDRFGLTEEDVIAAANQTDGGTDAQQP